MYALLSGMPMLDGGDARAAASPRNAPGRCNAVQPFSPFVWEDLLCRRLQQPSLTSHDVIDVRPAALGHCLAHDTVATAHIGKETCLSSGQLAASR